MDYHVFNVALNAMDAATLALRAVLPGQQTMLAGQIALLLGRGKTFALEAAKTTQALERCDSGDDRGDGGPGGRTVASSSVVTASAAAASSTAASSCSSRAHTADDNQPSHDVQAAIRRRLNAELQGKVPEALAALANEGTVKPPQFGPLPTMLQLCITLKYIDHRHIMLQSLEVLLLRALGLRTQAEREGRTWPELQSFYQTVRAQFGSAAVGLLTGEGEAPGSISPTGGKYSDPIDFFRRNNFGGFSNTTLVRNKPPLSYHPGAQVHWAGRDRPAMRLPSAALTHAHFAYVPAGDGNQLLRCTGAQFSMLLGSD